MESLSTSSPRTLAKPADGFSRPTRVFISVDLPDPLGPRSPRTSPRLTLSDTSFNATLYPYILRRWVTSTAGSVNAIASSRLFRRNEVSANPLYRKKEGADQLPARNSWSCWSLSWWGLARSRCHPHIGGLPLSHQEGEERILAIAITANRPSCDSVRRWVCV